MLYGSPRCSQPHAAFVAYGGKSKGSGLITKRWKRRTSRCNRPGPPYGYLRHDAFQRPRLLSCVVLPDASRPGERGS